MNTAADNFTHRRRVTAPANPLSAASDSGVRSRAVILKARTWAGFIVNASPDEHALISEQAPQSTHAWHLQLSAVAPFRGACLRDPLLAQIGQGTACGQVLCELRDQGSSPNCCGLLFEPADGAPIECWTWNHPFRR